MALPAMHSVLVLGGYGFFGARIAAGLAAQPGLRLLVGGRDPARAAAQAAQLGLSCEHALVLDAHDPALPSILRGAGVDTLIHTAGPFQEQDYDVAAAAIVAGCNYV